MGHRIKRDAIYKTFTVIVLSLALIAVSFTGILMCCEGMSLPENNIRGSFRILYYRLLCRCVRRDECPRKADNGIHHACRKDRSRNAYDLSYNKKKSQLGQEQDSPRGKYTGRLIWQKNMRASTFPAQRYMFPRITVSALTHFSLRILPTPHLTIRCATCVQGAV